MASIHAQYSYIFTLTHNLYDDRWSIFLENEGITSDYYKDSLIRMGATYLIDERFQIFSKENLTRDCSINRAFQAV